MPSKRVPTYTAFLAPGLLGGWIAKQRRIWQMDLLTASKFTRFAGERGIAFMEAEVVDLMAARTTPRGPSCEYSCVATPA